MILTVKDYHYIYIQSESDVDHIECDFDSDSECDFYSDNDIHSDSGCDIESETNDDCDIVKTTSLTDSNRNCDIDLIMVMIV